MPHDLDYAFLEACQEVVSRQGELVPALAETLGVEPTEVFYHWVLPPRCKQYGEVSGTKWKYFFHGFECDLKHADGRFLRVDFGPGGRYDAFTGFGVLRFIMTSKPPWRGFDELRTYLADGPSPHDDLSGSHRRMVALVKGLKAAGYVEFSDPDLCAWKKRHTVTDSSGRHVLRMPCEYTPHSRETYDISVSDRLVVSDLGRQVLAGKRR